MLRFVRLHKRFAKPASALRGAALLAVAVAAGGCSAGLDLPPLNYSGGPTGAVAPIPPEPMMQSRSSGGGWSPPSGGGSDYRSDYQQDYRSGDRSAGRPYARMDDRGAPSPRESDRSVRVAGLPEAYDRSPSYDRGPTAAVPRTPQPASFDAGRASPPPTPPAPPRAAYEPPSAPAQLQGDTIEVKAGDTLYSLAQTHRVSIVELMRANNLQGAQLRVGQQLVLPSNRRRPSTRVASLPSASAPMATPAPAPAPRMSDRSFSPPLAADPAAGPIVPPLVESPPAAPAASPSAESASPSPAPAQSTASAGESGWTGSHTVARGDSLYGIARKHGVRLNDLERVNNITNPRNIKPGTVLKVPQAGETTQVSSRAAPSSETPVAQQSGPPSVQPTIINSRTRVAALGKDATGAPPAEATVTPEAPPAASSPSRAASLPATKAPLPPGKFRWPVRGKIIGNFGKQPGAEQNDGINILVPRGTDVHAAETGFVSYAKDTVPGYGNLVLIRHEGGWITAYAHNDQLLVKEGDTVQRGQIIAKAGATGSVKQPQLHFEIRNGANAVDPIQHLER